MTDHPLGTPKLKEIDQPSNRHSTNTMQTADFAPPFGAATWRTRRNIPFIRVVFDFVLFYPLHDFIHITGSTYKSIALPSERTRAMTQVTCTEYWVKIGRVVFEICEPTDRQTDKRRHVHGNTSQKSK